MRSVHRPPAVAVAPSGRRRVGQHGHVSHRPGSVGTAVAGPDPAPVPYPPPFRGSQGKSGGRVTAPGFIGPFWRNVRP